MSAVEKNQSNVVRLVGNDADYIKREIDEANQAFGKSLEHYRNAGERLALVRDELKAKGQREKGVGFKSWVESNCDMTKQNAYNYIAVFLHWDELVSKMNLTNDIFTLVDALKAIKDIKATALQAQDDTYNTIATTVVDEIESNANKKVLEAHKQTDTERKAREKAEKELAKLNKQELALKATQNENKQLLSLVEGLQTQIATMQKPEVRTVTVIDDLATKELEKVKAKLVEKERQLSNITTGKSKTIVKEIVPEDYEELKKFKEKIDFDQKIAFERENNLRKNPNFIVKTKAKSIYNDADNLVNNNLPQEQLEIFRQIKEIIKPLVDF